MTDSQQKQEFDRIVAYLEEHFPMPKWMLYGEKGFPGYFYNMN